MDTLEHQQHLHIDIETFSSVDIRKSGLYKYIASDDFEILLIAYAFGDEEVQCIDLAKGDEIHLDFLQALQDKNTVRHAHNAAFERLSLNKVFGLELGPEDWVCSMAKSAYCGLPLALGSVAQFLKLETQKVAEGKALINFFSKPCKPTKSNEKRTRNLPEHDPEKWESYKLYCMMDVEVERNIVHTLNVYEFPEIERRIYLMDQAINDRGILVDLQFAINAKDMNETYTDLLKAEVGEITGLKNPNSVKQLKEWLSEKSGEIVEDLTKAAIPILIEENSCPEIDFVLKARQQLSKSSTKKYDAMASCAGDDNRIRGLFQYYGANRTGRWAGRLVQLQNLPQNHIPDLELARGLVLQNDLEAAELLFGNVPDTLSQLIRTAFVAPEGKILAVADFSAIEARVIAWLAQEQWRLDVFETHGKIYEASASKMFNVPIESIEKGSEMRTKGKIAELALGYQGALGALKSMGGESMGLDDQEMRQIVRVWRQSNSRITQLWNNFEECAMAAVKYGSESRSKYFDLTFRLEGDNLTIELPSGRKLFYLEPRLGKNKFGSMNITYLGNDQGTKQWIRVDTYGGKLTENIVQAVARDALAHSMLALVDEGFALTMHVHDEVVAEIDIEDSKEKYEQIISILDRPISWAPGLTLRADGYLTPFYKKD